MSLIAPEQIRSIDPYSQDRFSSAVNRFTRVLTGGVDCLLYPEESFLFTDKLSSDTSSNAYIAFLEGSAIKDDELLQITENGFVVDFEDENVFLDNVPGMISDGNYYVVLWYNYTREFPAPQAYYRILRQSEVFETYKNNYLFLAYAQVSQYSGEQLVTEDGEDVDIITEDGEYLFTERNESIPMDWGILEKGYVDPLNPTVGKRTYLTVSWIT